MLLNTDHYSLLSQIVITDIEQKSFNINRNYLAVMLFLFENFFGLMRNISENRLKWPELSVRSMPYQMYISNQMQKYARFSPMFCVIL